VVAEAEQVVAEPVLPPARRRRRREAAPRRRRATPLFSDREHELVCAAAAAASMAVDAWVAEVAVRVARSEVAVRVARSEVAPLPADWREVLAALIATRGQVRRVGVLLNQIAAHAHATGTVPAAAGRVAGMADRVVRRLDELTDQAGRRLR
jgi:hypothetical protein